MTIHHKFTLISHFVYYYFILFYLFIYFSITSLCQGWQRVQKVVSKANNEMHPYYKERVSKVLNTETEHAVVILLGREFQSEMEWGIKEYK